MLRGQRREIIGPADDEEPRVLEGVQIADFADYDTGHVIQNFELRNCRFSHCVLSCGSDPKKRTTVRRVRLLKCGMGELGSGLGNAIFDEVVIDGFRPSGGTAAIWGTAFRHVVLRGHLPAINFNDPVDRNLHVNEKFRKANQEFYRTVDWALDISEARSPGMQLRSIPGHLIRRDRETQILISRSQLIEAKHSSLPLTELTRIEIDLALGADLETHVLVAGKRSSSFKADLEGLLVLRRAGLTID